ncbi:MAG: DUF2384 domain-containing protein [Alphaproteobacteria bacterium]|nr:MAG: DUF2384 domain-containing protein [Alphaproteobacteria bacterium]
MKMQRRSRVKAPDVHDVDVGRRIRAQRLVRRMSQTELANNLGITFQQVQKYEKGVNRVGAGRLARIAEVLNVPVAFFFSGDISPSQSSDRANTGLSFLETAGATRLVRAYSQIGDPQLRRALVGLVEAAEEIAGTAMAPALAASMKGAAGALSSRRHPGKTRAFFSKEALIEVVPLTSAKPASVSADEISGRHLPKAPAVRAAPKTLGSLTRHGYSEEEIYGLVVPKRTLARRQAQNELLTVEETDKALRLARVAALAEKVFGAGEKAHRWLRKPKQALDGDTPLAYLASEAGARIVEEMLNRIESGMVA